MFAHFGRQLFGLALAYKQGAGGALAAGGGGVYQFAAAGPYQLGGFVEHGLEGEYPSFVAAGKAVGEHHTNQHDPFGSAEGFVGLGKGSAGHGGGKGLNWAIRAL